MIAGEALDDFIDGIKQDRAKDSTLPEDCTVHEINSNAIHFLQSLLGLHEKFIFQGVGHKVEKVVVYQGSQ